MPVTYTKKHADHPRRVSVPANDPSTENVEALTVPSLLNAGGKFLIKQGDILDVGISWSAWVGENDAEIATSSWAAHADTPQAPTIASDGINATCAEAFVVIDTSGAAVGDTYYLTNTITVSDHTPDATEDDNIPSRTLTRTIAVRVVN